MFGKFNENQPNVATILRQKLLFAGGGSERYALEKGFLLSDSCIFVPDADSCELRVSRHPANAIRETLFPELVFIRPERTGDGMFSLGSSPHPIFWLN